MRPLHVEDFPGPPDRIDMYPGVRPEGSYLLSGDFVYPLHGSLDDAQVVYNENEVRLNDLLHGRGVAAVEDRIPIIGYGSNANPARLVSKFKNSSKTVPVVRGRMKDVDIVFESRITIHGCVPAAMYPSKGTEVDAWLTLLDEEQLEEMHGSEGLKRDRTTAYKLGVFDYSVDGRDFEAYCYVGTARIWVEDAEDGRMPRRFAGEGYEMDDWMSYLPYPGHPGIYVSIDAENPRFREWIERDAMKTFYNLVHQDSGDALYVLSGDKPRLGPKFVHSSHADETYKEKFGELAPGGERKRNREKVKEFLADFGVTVPINVGIVDNPYAVEALKRMKDVA